MASVVWHNRGGYRARCTCRWVSGRYAHPEMARRALAIHLADVLTRSPHYT